MSKQKVAMRYASVDTALVQGWRSRAKLAKAMQSR